MQVLGSLFLVVTAALATMLAGQLALSRSQGRGLALAFLLSFALQTTLLILHGLRPDLLPTGLRAATGSALPVLLFLFFSPAARGLAAWRWRQLAHLLPIAAVTLLVAWPHIGGRSAGWAIDLVLLMIELGYGLALLSTDRRDPASPLRRRARMAAAVFLFSMAAVDVWIAWTLANTEAGGTRLGVETLVPPFLLATMAGWFAWTWRDPEWLGHLQGSVSQSVQALLAPPAVEPEPVSEPARALCAQLETLFQKERLYRDFGLDLERVAKRLHVPVKTLSAGINQIHGRGFRSLLNDQRVADAARQLRDPLCADKSITDIMFDAGFQTKSSFNKEFSARMSLSPSQYRQTQNP